MSGYQKLSDSQNGISWESFKFIKVMIISFGVGLLIGLCYHRYTADGYAITVNKEDIGKHFYELHKQENNKSKLRDLNDRPIIGVLSQEIDWVLLKKLPLSHRNYSSYIVSSYIQWVEAGGARAVPVIIGHDRDYYVKLFQGLNGLLLPGGNAALVGPGGYAEVGQIFYELAVNSTDNGDPFPIWGTCNGFELLTVLSNKEDVSRLTNCNSEDQASPLHPLPDWSTSRVYGKAPPDVLEDLTKEKVTINFHHFCLTPTNFTKYGMDKFWDPLSYNYDTHNLKYLSTIEAKKYPFVGTQFHPEKNIFEWAVTEPNIPHDRAAIHVSLYMATHFVNMARRSQHRFPDREMEESFLIYNYRPVYVGKKGIDWSFQESYLF